MFSLFTVTTNNILLCFFAIASLLFIFSRRKAVKLANPNGSRYPPGPNRLPVIGNLFDFALKDETATYSRMADEYGDLVFLSALGKNVLLVNSFQTAKDIFDKRSVNYSDRAQTSMIQLMGWDWSFGHMPYGDNWKAHRKMFHRQFQPSAAPNFYPTQLKEARLLLRRLLNKPQDLVVHLRHNSASLIMSVIYGISISAENDRYVSIAEKVLDAMAQVAKPGAFLVDLVPSLKYVPEWIPGASFKRKAREWKEAIIEMRDRPFEYAVNASLQGTASEIPSFVTNLLSEFESKENNAEEIKIIKGCAGLAYAGGAESTMSTLTTFFLAMVLYPEVKIKAQAELESVVGHGRLPDFNDRLALPYINAILKEVLRWNPVAPLGLPHMSTHDDVYNGYFIPAGTIIVGNSWKILHDPKVFPNPTHFNPDRFMCDNPCDLQHLSPVDPLSVAFGYGRRVCPGKLLAESQVWLSIASVLSVFDISPGKDEMGNPVKVDPKFTSGMICHPLPFKYSITPKSEVSRKLIEQCGDLVL